ncbi:uncharacterized protein A4U43_C04F3990 [Asparagus officinalis]|uniref:FYVE-type domain-containing protein n=1 Tax=Asparagus officinalis TaxID=4686 RepID=A0A5P1F3J4_ASPOF|nr:uncharacterized protein LOC109836577 isoform X2 [Asparagus officinalis]ONK71030.1 uncharacterized protein A4U43_C04F3990 [Asparagus officinalis]
MAEKSMRRAPLDRGVEQAIVSLKKGAHLLKCGRRGKPKFRPFRLSTDEKVLIWYSGEKEKQLKLKSVSKIVLGQKTVNFLRQSQPEKESQSFSLIYQNGARSLDLICKDREQAESWFLGLTTLLSVSFHPRPLTRVSRGVQSCTSSPVAHARRKYRLEVLEDSPKFAKVQSLYGSPPRSLLERFFSDSMFGSTNMYHPLKQRTLSDMQPILDEMQPQVPHALSESFRKPKDSDLFKEQNKILMSKTSLHMHESLSVDKTDTLKDVFMWGEGIGRFLGNELDKLENDDSKFDALVPRLLQSTRMLEVKTISCGESHAALVTKQGEVFSWGEENGGKLGHKINVNVSYPKLIDSLKGIHIQTISCGSNHTCAVSNIGEVYSWGDSRRNQWFPQKILGPLDEINIVKVSCGEWHTAVISSNGQLFTYGDGTFGVLGHGNVKNVHKPKLVESLKGLRVKSVACGPWHTAAIVEVITGRTKSNTPGGKLFTWGDGDKGQLGHLDMVKKLLPSCVASLVDCDFIQVSCGRTLTVALTVTGIVFTMGSAVYGQLGNPHARDGSISTVEGCLKSEFVKDISAGSFHVTALTTKGKVYTWGRGENGRLGLGDTRDRNYPVLIEALEDRNVLSVACGSNFTSAICSHKSISSKDQSVCSRCHMIFGFTRKKHNCYNCGFVFCHSCSSKKASNAALAPEKIKKYRVCDSCFAQLEKSLKARIDEQLISPKPLTKLKGFSDSVLRREESLLGRPRIFSPKVSNEEEIKLIQRKASSLQGKKKQCEQSFPHVIGKDQRWGQVSCPSQFSGQSSENPILFVPVLREENNHAHSRIEQSLSLPLLPKASSLKQDLTEIEKMLSEELKRLQYECQAKSLKLCQNKQRINETWALARDEASNCKAARDVIKILTNQINALSEKLSTGTQMNMINSIPDDKIHVPTPRPVHREVSESIPSSNLNIEGKTTLEQQKDAMTVENTRQRATKASRDEWVEQEEPGVYITFIALANGQKGLKRVRFSRRRFSGKEAEQWWEENQNRVYLKYDVGRVVTLNRNKIDN